MKTKTAKLFLALIFTAGLFMPLAFVHAASCPSNFTNLFNINPKNITTGSNVDTTNPTTQVHVYCSAGDLLTTVLNILFGFTGAVAVIFIIIGGFQFITSRGNDEQAEKGRKTLTNALIGLVVVVLAATIVRIVVNTVTGSTSNNGVTTTNPSGNNNTTTNPTNLGTSGADPSAVLNDATPIFIQTLNPNAYIVFDVTFPLSDASALTALCGSTSYTLTLNFKNNSNYHPQIPYIADQDGYTAKLDLLPSSFPILPDTVSYSVCGHTLSQTDTLEAYGNNGAQ